MILIVLLGITLVMAQVSHDPIDPRVVNVKVGRTVKAVPSNTAFKQSFPALGYDVGGRIFETHKGMIDSSLFNPDFYEQSTSCSLYKSQLKLKVISDININESSNIESIISSDSLGAMFAIISDQSYSEDQLKINRMLVSFEFNQTKMQKPKRNISVNVLGLNSSATLNIMLLMIQDRVIITDGVKLISVDGTNFSNHQEIIVDQNGVKQYHYQYASNNDLLKFTFCHYSSSQDFGILLATWNTGLRVYNILKNKTKAIVQMELTPPNNGFFIDAIPDHGKYWAITSAGEFVAFRPDQQKKYGVQIVKLESRQCSSINKYQTTLHIICREGGLNYVGEYFFNQSFTVAGEALKLNRYYNEVDDAKLLFRFGGDDNPKLIISGDNDLMMVPYAINRKVILDSNYAPRATRLRSLGVELIHSIPKYSNLTHNYAIGVGEYFLALFMVVQQPPEMQCRIMRTDEAKEFNILVMLNTTNCIANGDWQQLQSICTYYFTFNLYASLVEVDAANHKTIVATVLLLLLALAILVVGCGFYCKTNIEKASFEIKKKLAQLKKKEGPRPI